MLVMSTNMATSWWTPNMERAFGISRSVCGFLHYREENSSLTLSNMLVLAAGEAGLYLHNVTSEGRSRGGSSSRGHDHSENLSSFKCQGLFLSMVRFYYGWRSEHDSTHADVHAYFDIDDWLNVLELILGAENAAWIPYKCLQALYLCNSKARGLQ